MVLEIQRLLARQITRSSRLSLWGAAVPQNSRKTDTDQDNVALSERMRAPGSQIKRYWLEKKNK